MNVALSLATDVGPQATITVCKEPFRLRYRSPVLSPFWLSPPKPFASVNESFDKLWASGREKLTAVNSRHGLKTEARFVRRASRAAQSSS